MERRIAKVKWKTVFDFDLVMVIELMVKHIYGNRHSQQTEGNICFLEK